VNRQAKWLNLSICKNLPMAENSAKEGFVPFGDIKKE